MLISEGFVKIELTWRRRESQCCGFLLKKQKKLYITNNVFIYSLMRIEL
jgi:hypothetical protein